jgi:hypothetical protein
MRRASEDLAGEDRAAMRMRRFRQKSGGHAAIVIFTLAMFFASAAIAQESAKITWKAAPFAIVRYNDDAPKSWSLYHADKRGVLLLRLWKRYLLIDVGEEEVFDIDPQKVKVRGDQAECSMADIPDTPIEISDWRERDAGPVERIRFRFGKNGNYLDIEIPMRPDGKPAY